MKVVILKDIDDIWSGTLINVEEETDTHYIGLVGSMGGTYTIEVDKKYCVENKEGLSVIERLAWLEEQKQSLERNLRIDELLTSV